MNGSRKNNLLKGLIRLDRKAKSAMLCLRHEFLHFALIIALMEAVPRTTDASAVIRKSSHKGVFVCWVYVEREGVCLFVDFRSVRCALLGVFKK